MCRPLEPSDLSREKRAKIMRAIRSKNTKPEMAVRRLLHRAGYRYRVHQKSLPGKPDIVLQKWGAIIEVRGCFWHGHDCADGHLPKTNTAYWLPKLLRNKERDARNLKALKRIGYRVKVIWECQIKTPAKLTAKFSSLEKWLLRKSDPNA